MKWRKMGLIFCPSGQGDWMHSHAAVPIAEHLEGDLYRVYFSSRDSQNRSHTGSLVVDVQCPESIVDLSTSPILSPGRLGAFDDSGAMATWLAKTDQSRFLYYVGWNVGTTVPFRNSIGLATGNSRGHFRRYAEGPVVDRSTKEPHFCASCCVIPDQCRWRMWYLSCTGWSSRNGKAQPRYHIKYAESQDGIHWKREGIVAIDHAGAGEYAISRPSVLRDADGWKMWYSFRGLTYRIGYAESEDGVRWNRRDGLVGIDVSSSGWDSEMIEYPFVFDHNGARYMLYNGNGYGRTGFGLAVLEG